MQFVYECLYNRHQHASSSFMESGRPRQKRQNTRSKTDWAHGVNLRRWGDRYHLIGLTISCIVLLFNSNINIQYIRLHQINLGRNEELQVYNDLQFELAVGRTIISTADTSNRRERDAGAETLQ